MNTCKSWTCFVPIPPVPKGRPRVTKKGITYTPAKTKMAEAMIKHYVIDKNPPMFEGPLIMCLEFFIICPKSVKNRLYPSVKPDLDNLIKLVTDALEGVLYANDSQIIHFTASKRYDIKEGVNITIFPPGPALIKPDPRAA